GGLGGLLLAAALVRLLPPLLPANIRLVPLRPADGIRVDAAVVAFTFGAAGLTGVLFGLFPALAPRRGDLGETLRASARGSTAGAGTRLRPALVAAEVALAVVVLSGAGLMIASVARLLGVDPGLDPRGVLVMEMSLPQEDLYDGPPGNPRFCQQLGEEV